ncbi:MAG: ABC transporter permease [Lachnospiraceae bacterium]|nr:ABC transporter permease [Lachnospiraceae bacterium]
MTLAVNNKNSLFSLKGMGKVFKFTLEQCFKSKTYRSALILMVIFGLLYGPLTYFIALKSYESVEKIMAQKGYEGKAVIMNYSDYPLDEADIKDIDIEGGLPDFSIVDCKGQNLDKEALSKDVTNDEVLYVITSEGYTVNIDAVTSKDTEIDSAGVTGFQAVLSNVITENLYDTIGFNPEDRELIQTGLNLESTVTEEKYDEIQGHEISSRQYSTLSNAVTIIVFLIITLSSSYIFTSVTEEKLSKLAETIILSVRPLALLTGKILAMLLYTVIMLGATFAAAKVSSLLIKFIPGYNSELALASGSAFNLSGLSASGIPGIIIFVLCLLIAIASFGVFAGVLAATISKEEDMQSGMGSLTIVMLVGYLVGLYLTDSKVCNLIGAFVPPVSYFRLATGYISGRIGIVEAILGIGIQVIILIALCLIAAKTYHKFLLSGNTKSGIKSIISMIKEK